MKRITDRVRFDHSVDVGVLILKMSFGICLVEVEISRVLLVKQKWWQFYRLAVNV